MRNLLAAAAVLAFGASPAVAQTSNPIKTIELPPSAPAPIDPFASMPEEVEPLEPPAVEPAGEAASLTEAETSAIGRVDAIMETFFGPSEEEQRAVAAGIYAEQAERHALDMRRIETLNREARESVEAENARRLAEYEAEVERLNSEHAARQEARMAEWRARVAACEAGDRASCR